MNARRIIFIIVTAMLGMALPAYGQQTRQFREVAPSFFVDAISYASDSKDKSRIDFYVQIPYEELRFIKEGEMYVASYDVTLTMESSEKQTLQDHSWSVDVRVPEFSQTISHKLYSLAHQSIDVAPGNYHIVIQVRDQETRISGNVKRSLLITDYGHNTLSLSDIMLVSRLTTTSEGKNRIVPNISGTVGTDDEGFFLFFEIYDTTKADVTLKYRIHDKEKGVVKEGVQVQHVDDRRTQAFIKIDSLDIPVGTYFLTVDATQPFNDSAQTATTSRTFSFRWSDIPFSITNLDKAIEQLRYLAQESEYSYMRNATTDEEKRERFIEFWKKRDPDPSTERNELMEEYYNRVAYANTNFGHFIDGWKTDMGMVHIRFGAPDNIERHPFESNSKPYQVWYYYDQERRFIFVDETGFGDFRLRYPATDIWGRVR